MGRCAPKVIAIDGPAASGKSTLGMRLADRLGFDFLDTGMLYRAVTLLAVEREVPPEEEAMDALLRETTLEVVRGNPSRVLLNGTDVTDLLRLPKVERAVSAYSALPVVRAWLLPIQREFAQAGRAVIAGRDVGTVVLPDAPVKFFLDASAEARALRRSAQASSWGVNQAPEEAAGDITLRDSIDSSRAVAPLRPAPDAVVIDTTDRSPEEVFELAWSELGCAR